ncbi:MAG: hypothetical protein J6W76_05715, partial [Spirochaetales bacterium]|nr:hypothetical protein [Spirochaetales bacterium]
LLNNEAIRADYYNNGDKSKKRSEAMAEFCYNELCLNFDINYGLKAMHGIEAFPDFDTYFACVGIRDSLKSTDAEKFATAIKDICEFYFGDGHSAYQHNSHYLGADVKITATHTFAKRKEHDKNTLKYVYTRNDVIGNGSRNTIDPVPGYTVSADGKTAIVRFDEFTVNNLKGADIPTISDEDLEKYVYNLEKKYDTIALLNTVNEKIHTNSNIENVVLDLSRNGGGAAFTAAFLLSWMLGECTFNLTDPITGAKWSTTYEADVNFDGKYDANDESVIDKQDTIKNKNLFCLISPLSFSCGNLVPAVLKASGQVTILGVASTGGTAAVYNTCTADGTLFQMSSRHVINIAINGSSYDIDKGIEPHYYINKVENFYKTDKIASLVNSINEAKLGD